MDLGRIYTHTSEARFSTLPITLTPHSRKPLPWQSLAQRAFSLLHCVNEIATPPLSPTSRYPPKKTAPGRKLDGSLSCLLLLKITLKKKNEKYLKWWFYILFKL